MVKTFTWFKIQMVQKCFCHLLFPGHLILAILIQFLVYMSRDVLYTCVYMHVYPHSFFFFLRPMQTCYIHCFAPCFCFFSSSLYLSWRFFSVSKWRSCFWFLEKECGAFHCMDELCIRLFSNSGSKKTLYVSF